MGVLDTVAKGRIREAFAGGEFEHLPGAWQPLALDDDELVPPELRWQPATLFETGWASGGVRCSMRALAGYAN
jgi:hypothetical protein